MKDNYYLKGLTSIRFLLTSLVVLTHCNQNLMSLNIYWHKDASVFAQGSFAVECFFILSGFLLTHLAFIEYRKFGRIDFKRFFVRRILRIFPLYYLAVFLGYVTLGVLYPILSGEDYLSFPLFEGLLFHTFFLPNWVISKYTVGVGSLYSLWSIGVEEQFYLFFPFVCWLFFDRKRPALWFGVTSVCFFLGYSLIQAIDPMYIDQALKLFFGTLKFHFMLLGGAFALLLQQYSAKLTLYFSNKLVEIGVLILFLVLILTNYVPYNGLLYGVVFCLLLVSISIESSTFKFWENPHLKYLGSISFGIYLYHPLVSYPLRYLLESYQALLKLIMDFPILYYLAELSLTIMVASLSYRFFEMKFLNLKQRYAVLKV